MFAKRLKQLRVAKGLNQSDMATYLGVSDQSYSTYENGREPKYKHLVALAKNFNVTTDYLLGNDTTGTYNPLEEENKILKERLAKAISALTE